MEEIHLSEEDMADQDESYLARVQRCYGYLRKSRIVKNAPLAVDDDALNHFIRYVNEALPTNPEEEAVEQTVKHMYFGNKGGFVRGLTSRNKSNNARRDTRCYILLTIGLEIVREFGLTRVIHLQWNKQAREYEINLLLDPDNLPDRDTFRAEEAEARRERFPRRKNNRMTQMQEELTALRDQVASMQPEEHSSENESIDETVVQVEPTNDNPDTSGPKKWSDM